MKDQDDFLAETILNIVRASNILERLGGNYAKEGDLGSVQQYMILAMLSNKDHLSMTELRKNTLVTKQAVTGLVNRMKQNNYIDTYKDPKDRRITRVYLTKKGKDALQTIRPKRVAGNRRAFSVLTKEEISQLSIIMEKLIIHLKKE